MLFRHFYKKQGTGGLSIYRAYTNIMIYLLGLAGGAGMMALSKWAI
jgi:hypothetical protein